MMDKEFSMNGRFVIGLFLLIGGILAFGYGLNASNSLVEQISTTFLGRFSEATTWYMIGGLAAAVVGLLFVLAAFIDKRA